MDRPLPERAGAPLPADLLEHVSGRLQRGGRVARALPGGGRLMIDRPLPFICVLRSNDHKEEGVVSIVRAQTAYLDASADPAHAADIRALLLKIAEAVPEDTEAFLIIELWAADPASNSNTYKILGPLDNAPETAEALKKGLGEIASVWRGTKVKMVNTDIRHPPYAYPLFELEQLKKAGILVFGIEIPQVYRNKDGGLSDIALRRVRDRMTVVVKQTVHAFTRVQSPKSFSHYLMLGRTRFTRLAMNIDKALARISGSFDLLLNVSPVNTEEAWHEFQASDHAKRPDLHYRLIAVDPEMIKRELYALRIDDMEDTTLQAIFRSKREELDTQATLMSERGRRGFLYSGIRLYGGVNDDILEKAKHILRSADRGAQHRDEKIHAEEFAALAKKEFEFYKGSFPGVDLKVSIRDDLPGIMVSKAELLIGEKAAMDAGNANALIQHEVGTHMLTYGNGRQQPFRQLYVGMAGYEQLQEGLAVMAEYLTGGLSASRYKLLAGRVIAVHALIHGATFVECFHLLHDEHGFPARSAFNITTRVYRGGGLPKDAIYLKGLIQLIDHLDGSTEGLELFYTGKFALAHLPLIEDLHHRGVLKKPVLPRFLTPEAREKLSHLRKGMDLALLMDDRYQNL